MATPTIVAWACDECLNKYPTQAEAIRCEAECRARGGWIVLLTHRRKEPAVIAVLSVDGKLTLNMGRAKIMQRAEADRWLASGTISRSDWLPTLAPARGAGVPVLPGKF